jgi:uncharacterized protein YdaU (DUF1376 family)
MEEIKRMSVPTPWMAFYPDRFTKQTDQLRPIEHSAYYRLFESYAQTGYLLDDPYMLRCIVKLDSELTIIEALTGMKPDYCAWITFTDGIIAGLLERFFTLGVDGCYHHSGWDKELDRARASYEARVKGAMAVNGKRAAERIGEQRTSYNGQRTAIEPAADTSTTHTGERPADSPERIPDNLSEQPVENGTTDNMCPARAPDSATAAVAGSSGPDQTGFTQTGHPARPGSKTRAAAPDSGFPPENAPVRAADHRPASGMTYPEKLRRLPDDWEQRPWLHMTSEEFEQIPSADPNRRKHEPKAVSSDQ